MTKLVAQSVINSFFDGKHADPFAVLGMHETHNCSRSRILGNVTAKSENSEKSVISHFKRILTANFEKRKRPLN